MEINEKLSEEPKNWQTKGHSVYRLFPLSNKFRIQLKGDIKLAASAKNSGPFAILYEDTIDMYSGSSLIHTFPVSS